MSEAASAGVRLDVVAARRSVEAQTALHRERPAMAVSADRSRHVTGEAVDLSGPWVRDDESWAVRLRAHGLRYLKTRSGKVEPWHVERL